ncbi:MAG: response regulator [Clostridia bacterium]|nr:response regulator [Clostridia bacterium]
MNVIYVDDEAKAINRFLNVSKRVPDLKLLMAFCDADKAIEYAKSHKIDIAFLDIQMGDINGLQLAKTLKIIDSDIKIVFVTAYAEYALDAFDVDAIAYLLKPYNAESLSTVIEKAKRILPAPKNKVYIKTIPHFEVLIDGNVFPINSLKCKELLAILVDRNGGTISSRIAMSYLWEDKDDSLATQSLYRMTYKRLRDILEEGGIDFILGNSGQQRFVNTSTFECDYYKLLNGDRSIMSSYAGEYMSEYWWAEETNAAINSLVTETLKH